MKKEIICPSLISNISRDKLIEKINDNNIKTNQEFKCRYCPKTLTSRNGIYVHETKCKHKNNKTDIIIANPMNQLLIDLDKNPNMDLESVPAYQLLRDKLETDIIQKLGSSNTIIGTQNNTINQNTIDQSTVNNNNMYYFGSEQPYHLDKDFMSDCFLRKDIPGIVKQIHFSHEHPKNNNVRLKNNDEKSDYLEIYNEGYWFAKDKETTVNELIMKGYRELEFYEYKNREEFKKICKDEDENHFDFSDWMDDIVKKKKYT